MPFVVLPRQYIADINGEPRVGARLSVYDAGTNDTHVVYTTEEFDVPLSQPISADELGYFPTIHFNADDGDFKITIHDANGSLIYTQDYLSASWLTAQSVGAVLSQNLLGGVLYPQTGIEDSSSIIPAQLVYPAGNAFRYGVDPTGLSDASTDGSLQKWINSAWAMYSSHDIQGYWDGSNGGNPIAELPPGKYRVTGPTLIPTGINVRAKAHPTHTLSHTRIIMDSSAISAPNGVGDNRNKAIFKFARGSQPGGGGSLVNAYYNGTIENLEFWYVTGSNDFDNPLGVPPGITFGDYPDGGALLFDVDTVDARIVNCVFQHAPACLRLKDVPASLTTRGDGFTGSTGIHMYVEHCEYDTAAAHVYATNTHFIGLTHRHCSFYGTLSYFRESCSGVLIFEGCELFGDAGIDLNDQTNGFELFKFHGRAELRHQGPTLYVVNAKNVDIDIVMDGASGATGILLYNCDGGCVRAVIQNSGYDAAAGTGPTDYTAAIKLMGCRDVRVEAVITKTATGGTYNGFGVLSVDSDRAAARNVINAVVNAPYDGTAYRGQSRYVNIGSSDILEFQQITQTSEGAFNQYQLKAKGTAIADNNAKTATYSVDLNTALPDTGCYFVVAQAYPDANFAILNIGTFMFMKRAAGGGVLMPMGAPVNGSTTGVISSSGTTITFTKVATDFHVGLFYHLMTKASVG